MELEKDNVQMHLSGSGSERVKPDCCMIYSNQWFDKILNLSLHCMYIELMPEFILSKEYR